MQYKWNSPECLECLVEIWSFLKRQCHSCYNQSRNVKIRRPHGVAYGIIFKYFVDETKLKAWVLWWSCWDPVGHTCKCACEAHFIPVWSSTFYSTCVSFTHQWLSAAAGVESVIHHDTFTLEHMATPAEAFLPGTRLISAVMSSIV